MHSLLNPDSTGINAQCQCSINVAYVSDMHGIPPTLKAKETCIV